MKKPEEPKKKKMTVIHVEVKVSFIKISSCFTNF